MKKYIKEIILKYKENYFINYFFYQRKYHMVGISLVIINFIFQRIFRLNSDTQWMVNFTSRVISSEKIKIYNIKNNASVFASFSSSGSCYIQAINGIEIHKDVLWASGVKLISSNHDLKNLNVHNKSKPIVINKNVWIGANVIILPSIEIGEFSIIGAGSVVTKNIPSFTINGGNPAKILSYRCKKCLNKLINMKCTKCNHIFTKEEYL